MPGADVLQAFYKMHPFVDHDPDMELPVEDGKINGLFGWPDAGKSRLVCWLIAALYCDVAPFGLGVGRKPTKIMYLRGEEGLAGVVHRIEAYAQLMGSTSRGWPIRYFSAVGLGMEKAVTQTRLNAAMDDFDFGAGGLLIIDPLRRVHGGDEDKSNSMSKLNNVWRQWTDRRGIDIVFIHHTGHVDEGKNMDELVNWARGSSDIAAVVDTGALLQKFGKTEENGTRHLKLRRTGRFEPQPPLELLDRTDKEGWCLDV